MSRETCEAGDCLKLRTVPHPGRNGQPVRAFASEQKALEHLCNHVLTHPEAEAWAAVVPEACQLVDLTDADCCWRFAKRLQRTDEGAQQLYDLYVAAIAGDCSDAIKLGWVACEGRVTVAIGTSGVISVFEDVLKTAFIGGCGDSQAVEQSKQTTCAGGTNQTVLPRQRTGMRKPRNPAARVRSSEKKHRLGNDPEKKIYYLAFKPSLQFVKSRHLRQRDIKGDRIRRCDYALLKDKLPSRRKLKFDAWLGLRRQCREHKA